MLPRLQAQERLGAIDVGFLTSGGYDERTARMTIDSLRNQASGEGPPRAIRPRPDQLAAIGIAMIQVAPERPLNDG